MVGVNSGTQTEQQVFRPKSKQQQPPTSPAAGRRSTPAPLAAAPLHAVNCTTQASLAPGGPRPAARRRQPHRQRHRRAGPAYLQANLLPTVTGDWESIRSVAQAAIPLFKGGRVYWGDGYLLDATDLKAPTDTEFFCTNARQQRHHDHQSAQPARRPLRTAHRRLRRRGPGRSDRPDSRRGYHGRRQMEARRLFVREGALDGHDGLWYWRHARELAQQKSPGAAWSAWFSYDFARWLLLPIDFLSSPHLEKLNKEQSVLGASPADSAAHRHRRPAGSREILAHHRAAHRHYPARCRPRPHYEGTGITEPVQARAEAIAVMSALLKLHPELRRQLPRPVGLRRKRRQAQYAIELAMHDIP
jgi:hypothetical protein